MMVMMDTSEADLPPFQEYLDHKLTQQKTNYFNSTSTTKAVPLNEVIKDLFFSTNQDNKDSTLMLEDLGVVAETRWVQELLYPKKATYPLMSESGAEYSWDGFQKTWGKHWLASWTWLILQRVHYPVWLTNSRYFFAASIRNMSRNIFLDRHTTNKEISDKKKSLFHDFP